MLSIDSGWIVGSLEENSEKESWEGTGDSLMREYSARWRKQAEEPLMAFDNWMIQSLGVGLWLTLM